MTVTVSSIFRDSASYLPRYFDQIAALRTRMDVRLVLGEGDSSDPTPLLLPSLISPTDTIVTHNHGGQHYGSVDHPTRWANIAKVVRAVIDAVEDPGDAFIYVESDLIWDADTMLQLVKDDICVAPMVLAGNTPRYYDTFSFRMEGKMFLGHPPYFPVDPPTIDDFPLVKIDSCGSCFVLPRESFHLARDWNWNGVWPFSAGGKLWLDRKAVIYHP